MSNPAGTLLEIFRRWNLPDSPTNVRRPDTEDRVEDHLVAMRCLLAIRDELDVLERVRNVGPARRAFPRWVRAVVVYSTGWSSSEASATLYDETSVLDPLETLADILETRSLAAGNSTDGVNELLEHARRLVADDTGLDPHLRWYILRLVEECQRALADVERFGTFDLDDALERLWVAVNAAAERSSDPSMKERWRAFASTTISAAIGGAIANAPAFVAALTAAQGH